MNLEKMRRQRGTVALHASFFFFFFLIHVIRSLMVNYTSGIEGQAAGSKSTWYDLRVIIVIAILPFTKSQTVGAGWTCMSRTAGPLSDLRNWYGRSKGAFRQGTSINHCNRIGICRIERLVGIFVIRNELDNKKMMVVNNAWPLPVGVIDKLVYIYILSRFNNMALHFS